uniref:Phosducin thioredoxin-like domain-containing protein n=1 Tax=Picea sitchensis TaxID=3332 RepID=A9NMQ5_PICSI|nr:unknown [Picea sitchensis]
MGDYHFVYKDVEGTSTQWDDIQRKLGNLPPKPAPFKPPAWTPDSSTTNSRPDKSKEWMDTKNEEELEDLEDDPDLDDDRFLAEYRVPECGILGQCLDELATKYPATKFVKIISTDCIPNYPDRNLPTLLIYNNSNVKETYVGLHHFGGRRCTPEGVAFTLCQTDPVLKDREDGTDSSKEALMKQVQNIFIQKVVAEHEQEDDGRSSDDD